MAAVDIVNRTMRVTLVGSSPAEYSILKVKSIGVWSANTTANLLIAEIGTAGEVLRHTTNDQLPSFVVYPIQADFGRLSFTAVTACTAYLYLA